MLIIDEVQTGFGRTGKMFACEHFGVSPDLMAMGKAIAGGVPMGAIGIGDAIGDLAHGIHGSTFGGNPLACAAALANLSILDSENLIENVQSVGQYFIEQLEQLDCPEIREGSFDRADDRRRIEIASDTHSSENDGGWFCCAQRRANSRTISATTDYRKTPR